MGYFKLAVSGISWMGGLRIASRGLVIVKTGILARLLSPSQFGIYGIAALTLSLLETIVSTGINIFLIQENRKLEDYVDSAWLISIIRGLVISSILYFSAPFVSEFFRNSEAEVIIQLLSLSALIRGFINPSRVSMQKNLLFRKEFVFTGSLLIVESVVAISLAFILRSPLAIAWGLIISAVFEVILSFILLKPKPKWNFDLTKIKEIIGTGKWITTTKIFAYLFQEGDDMVVGKLLNSASLGYYQMAYKISTLPITEGFLVTNMVSFPIFTKIKNDKKRLLRAYIKSTLLVTLLSLPFAVAFIVFPEQVVNLVLGDKWLSIVPVLQILTIYGVVQSILATTNTLFYSTNNHKYVMIATFTNFFGMALLVYPMVLRYGILGAGIAALLGSLLSAPVRIYYLYRFIRN